jgi:ribosomal-protein-alanine N-acetyltransferase
MTESIISQRLELRPMTPAFLQASLDGDRYAAARHLGVNLPLDWPENRDLLSLRLQQLHTDPTLQPWLLRAMCHREKSEMVGHIGFHTSPGAEYLDNWLPGAAEFGFTVFPTHRRQGYAKEATQAVMQWAHEMHGVSGFVLTISPDNIPSQSLATKLGFNRIGSHEDEVDGTEDIFALQY